MHWFGLQAIPGRVIAGAYPSSLDDDENMRILTLLLEFGVNTFVCLQAEASLDTPEKEWRAQRGLRPYIKDAQQLLSQAREKNSKRILQHKLDYLHLPILDGGVTTDAALSRLAEDCMQRIRSGEILYIHCWGGHGRTGTLVSVLLGRLYHLTAQAAMRHCQAYHDARIFPQNVPSPQTPVQQAQVRRLLAPPNPAQRRAAAAAAAALSASRHPLPSLPGAAPPSRPHPAALPSTRPSRVTTSSSRTTTNNNTNTSTSGSSSSGGGTAAAAPTAARTTEGAPAVKKGPRASGAATSRRPAWNRRTAGVMKPEEAMAASLARVPFGRLGREHSILV